MFSNIPMGWKLVTIDDVFEVIRGVSFPKTARSEATDELVGCLRTANVQKNIVWDDLWKIPIAYLPTQDKLVRKNDIIISTANSLTLLGKSAMVTYVPMPCTFGTFVVNLRAKTAEFKYLYYYLQSRMFLEQVAENASTTTNISNISTAKLKRLIVPLPTLEKQKRIVARIEELFSELDNGVETLQKTKQQLAVYRQAVLSDAFSEIEDYSSLQSISDRIFDGPFGSNLKTSDYTSTGIRVVRLENIKEGWFDNSKQSFVTQEKYDTISNHTVFPNDLIMSTFIADSIKVCQLPKSVGYAVNKADCIGIRLKEGYLQEYVMYYLMTKMAYDSLVHEVHGATRPRVNTKQIKGISIPICDKSKQKQIVAKVEARLSVCDSIERTVDTALQQAEALRQSILKQAFEGRL